MLSLWLGSVLASFGEIENELKPIELPGMIQLGVNQSDRRSHHFAAPVILRPFGQNLFERAPYRYDRAAIYYPFFTPETPVAFVLLEPEHRQSQKAAHGEP